jgi:hypothetical protein
VQECSSIKIDNENITHNISNLESDLNQIELKGSDVNKQLNDTFEIIILNEQQNTSELERTEVKLHLLEETLNRRSDKYKLVVKK